MPRVRTASLLAVAIVIAAAMVGTQPEDTTAWVCPMHSDYTSEYRLRRLEPPYDLVSDDLDKMIAQAKKHLSIPAGTKTEKPAM